MNLRHAGAQSMSNRTHPVSGAEYGLSRHAFAQWSQTPRMHRRSQYTAAVHPDPSRFVQWHIPRPADGRSAERTANA
ncbi:unnamed protein product [Mycetohabitans rhizoxinica HKI 454]|uniref:Uncharacterized protein n=1 Tax=Mycetohabitans rhizoxinica (strain DSM 19002 / CIP 109453 / HKI 454) TaxID=882378 RepID=E5AR69_MYCRK|nr:unnamed protein product [Mycetohabitans rhizoxinica HKI 454]